ncbi:MAG: RNB domain-containing ribonuclease [Dehalococcoidia bacterium]|nr:RNB domain-containing ribonuclease [Dehalococcoidia bacterium]
MLNSSRENGRSVLERVARRAMTERELWPDFSKDALHEIEKIQKNGPATDAPAKDLRHLLWASIDNDDSLDLDQLTAAEALSDGTVRILVAIADVDTLVPENSAIDAHASHNTTSVYTAGKVFPMLPERLSTDLTSLNAQENRPTMVIEMVVNDAGEIVGSDIYPALVRNHAKLAYNSLAEWMEGKQSTVDKTMADTPELAENLRIQEAVAQKLRARREERGALELQTLNALPVFEGDEIQDLQVDQPNRANELIEDFMIAANHVTAQYLRGKKVLSLRRVVRSPRRWDKIVEVAAQHGFQLPPEPDPRALSRFLHEQKAAEPLRFPDLSLSVIKLLGSGEYVVDSQEEPAPGHFGLAVSSYTHSTAPNRRFPDLVTQRILKATMSGAPMPYNQDELTYLAKHCTEKEDDANKVERLVAKSAAAMLLSSRIGDQFDALCTGAADKGTWVPVFNPMVEGRLMSGYEGVDVGDRLKVRLIHTDVERGFIDFEMVQS